MVMLRFGPPPVVGCGAALAGAGVADPGNEGDMLGLDPGSDGLIDGLDDPGKDGVTTGAEEPGSEGVMVGAGEGSAVPAPGNFGEICN